MIRIEDFGELVYGGGVTLAEWWDNRRIDEGKITNRDFFMKASTYTYLGIGVVATMMSIFGWMPQWRLWAEHISHGFLYDLPRFGYNLSRSIGAAGRKSSESAAAVAEAQRILRQRTAANKLLASGRTTDRSYQPEFEEVSPHAF